MGMTPEILAELKKLGELRDAGILSPEEFEAEKSRLMRPSVSGVIAESELTSIDNEAPQTFDDEPDFLETSSSAAAKWKRNLDHGFAEIDSMGAINKIRFRIAQNAAMQYESKGFLGIVIVIGRGILALYTLGLSELILFGIRKMKKSDKPS